MEGFGANIWKGTGHGKIYETLTKCKGVIKKKKEKKCKDTLTHSLKCKNVNVINPFYFYFILFLFANFSFSDCLDMENLI